MKKKRWLQEAVCWRMRQCDLCFFLYESVSMSSVFHENVKNWSSWSSQAVDVRPYNFISKVIMSIHYKNLKSMLRNYYMKCCGLDRVTHSWTLQGTACHTAWHCTISNWPRHIRKPHSDKCSYTWFLYILIWIHT